MGPFWAISPLVKLLAKLLGQSNGYIVIVIVIGGGEGGGLGGTSPPPPHYIHPCPPLQPQGKSQWVEATGERDAMGITSVVFFGGDGQVQRQRNTESGMAMWSWPVPSLARLWPPNRCRWLW